MVYIALLRGINVGGKNKIDMKMLKGAFERVGMNSVVTYINSGNIIFTDNGQSKTKLSHILEEAIHETFGLQIKVLVLSIDDLKKVMHSLPESWTNDQQMKSDVLFLWDDVNDDSVLDKLVIKPGIDTVNYVTGALLWSVDRKNVTRSGMMKLAGSKIYQQMTVRNVNTTRKIYELMQAAEK
ncbi:DUF1697 domain-containing protein [Paenibacillus apiarius]|uniref:DUF1697 domain-containing protein n=1 Tax=Paenibacillus apiarius TaxID=46240 RepID=A0ABT4E003_9BACL|nr:DUF1697 domain-containing protein [Paenibacillus apiarius]MCY9515093.1 DUF1697 domain-containing protein [Paenibacillus apiarius]MCY9522921.1 DUF1697 domain-containing protein [Paenibacillus apiarius]MCY9553724.1 DUF1697 domain-containing protein [Paenibacillus apiarius]MCY9556443.1 DUF1697 domain-containing protein [Paenibacillus apiarius]MCY9684877.1 DUF1697 domain-containing protein [Paenibacillus apiarius]